MRREPFLQERRSENLGGFRPSSISPIWKSFLTLADELHFARTAERLHMTQSRVSQSLREFETKLGVELVHRTTRRVELSDAGARLRES